jgi:hypothetical protein
MTELTDGLEKQPYQIKDELKIRKILETHSSWQFEFRKYDKYEYDLSVRKWADSPEDCDANRVIGYVELERSRGDKKYSWVSGDIPDSWVFISFLKRKVNQFDTLTKQWGPVKSKYDKTVYLKFNHQMDNCFCVPVEVIHEHGEVTPRSDGSRSNTYLSLETDNPQIRFGINNCVSFIESYLTDDEREQEPTLFDY